jgi:carboxypeptidase PM20D1
MGVLTAGLVPGMSQPVAGIAIAEKGYATLELRASAEGGHSSTPPPHTAVGILAQAVAALERDQMPARLGDVTGGFFAYLAPEMPFWFRVPLANANVFAPLVTPFVGGVPPLNALFRTTTAATMLSAGTKENVLPTRATATVNFRILPGDTVQGVVDHARRAIADPRVEVVLLEGSREPSPVSPIGDERFAMLQRTIGEVFPDAIVAPALTLGGTDLREYASVGDHLYRFAPQVATPSDLKRIHGIDERLSVDGFADAVRFYTRFIENASAP